MGLPHGLQQLPAHRDSDDTEADRGLLRRDLPLRIHLVAAGAHRRPLALPQFQVRILL